MIRVDLYYGFKEDKGPTDREQRFFNPEMDDLEEFLEECKQTLGDSLATLLEEGEESATDFTISFQGSEDQTE